MGRLIDIENIDYVRLEDSLHCLEHHKGDEVECVICAPTVEAIPREEVRQFIENIQKIKDNHNEYGEPINYGTICGILIEGYRLLDKYRKGKNGNDD